MSVTSRGSASVTSRRSADRRWERDYRWQTVAGLRDAMRYVNGIVPDADSADRPDEWRACATAYCAVMQAAQVLRADYP